MSISLSQGQSVSFAGATVANVTQASVSESAPLIDVSSLNLADQAYRQYLPGLREPAEITVTTLNGVVGSIGATGSVDVGSLSFGHGTVMSTDVAYRVGEVIAFTTTIRAFQ